MKNQKIKNAKFGDKVVLNNLDDAVVYTIVGQQGFLVQLEYTTEGYTYDGGVIDISLCYVPNSKQ